MRIEVVMKKELDNAIEDDRALSKQASKLILVGCMDNSDGTLESANRVYSPDGLAPTIPTCCGGGHQPKFLVKTKGKPKE